MNRSMPGYPDHHQLSELAQTHAHWVSDAIQASHPLSFPSLPAFDLSQHQGLFQWVSSLLHVAKVLEFQFHHQSFPWIFRTDFQNEREIKFIRVGDAVRTVSSSRENQCWTGVLSPLLYPGYKEWDRGLVGHLLIGWGMYTGWGKTRAKTFSLWGRRDRLYCSTNSCDMGEGRTIMSRFFCSCIPTPSLVLSALVSLGHYTSQGLKLDNCSESPES